MEMRGIESGKHGTTVTRWVDSETRRLGLVLGLPLLDGVFIALVLTGLLESLLGIVVMGVLVFGGTATAAVILAAGSTGSGSYLPRVAVIGVVLVPVAGLQAAIAPNLAAILDIALLERFASLVLLLIAVGVARPEFRDRLPRPWLVVGLGLVASFEPNGVANGLAVAPELGWLGALAATIGIVVAAGVAAAGTRLCQLLDPGRLRLGSGVALGVLGISLVTPVTTGMAALVLLAAIVVAISPGDNRGAGSANVLS